MQAGYKTLITTYGALKWPNTTYEAPYVVNDPNKELHKWLISTNGVLEVTYCHIWW